MAANPLLPGRGVTVDNPAMRRQTPLRMTRNESNFWSKETSCVDSARRPTATGKIFLSIGHWLLIICPAMVIGSTSLSNAQENKIPVVQRNGQACVAASTLMREAGIAIKHLPGMDQFVACSQDRCAPVKEAKQDGSEIWVPVKSLATALGATTQFTSDQTRVSFHFTPAAAAQTDSIARVGQLAPNFRLTKLDGSSVALADFRGQRVVINSWASW